MLPLDACTAQRTPGISRDVAQSATPCVQTPLVGDSVGRALTHDTLPAAILYRLHTKNIVLKDLKSAGVQDRLNSSSLRCGYPCKKWICRSQDSTVLGSH